ncbi:ABC transporter ATP-binding protein [Helicobacter sp. 13S00477-4]|uniref:dipeptide ABC transporter ATP-binding protein n=1 Tax=Helicobacter sp. 13S00477-4 TaxID=1905759 RepID=UPI000BA721F5|nr:ABC transporter ATP-binding protein [Helicobacter sp. 13S00477-4]PAF52883.1 peptide ABC transporter ATP-binding protein [Helicobacter sp. 13S00477-4]
MLKISHLNCSFEEGFCLKDISLGIGKAQRVGLVGESGSGKSLIANIILRSHLPIAIQSGVIEFEGYDLLTLDDDFMRKIRGRDIAYVAQEPLSSLNPLQKVGFQVLESLLLHCPYLSKKEMWKKVDEVFLQTGLELGLKNRYPYQLSGGQRQRVSIAMGIVNRPKILICDEPTTALDANIQKQILELLRTLGEQNQIAILLISHDLGVIRGFVDRIYVVNKGKICEEGQTQNIFEKPKNAYTKKLLDSLNLPKKSILPTNKKIFEVKNFGIIYGKKKIFFKTDFKQALLGINFSMYERETLGIVGESGSGKSSLAMGILKLIKSQGEEYLLGKRVDTLNQKTFKPYRKDIQVVFQDPYASLNPRMRVRDIISEALRLQYLQANDYHVLIEKILDDVGLDGDFANFFPYQLSGGQRQRVAIARAIILKPKIIVLDEPTSALDKRMQKIILELLLRLQEEFGLSYLFISHDLDVIEAVCDRVIVLQNGRLIESGSVMDVFGKPKELYTKSLIESRIR